MDEELTIAIEADTTGFETALKGAVVSGRTEMKGDDAGANEQINR